MKPFSKAIVYKIIDDEYQFPSFTSLEKILSEKTFKDLSDNEGFRSGWRILFDKDHVHLVEENLYLLQYGIAEKKIPAAFLKRKVEERLDQMKAKGIENIDQTFIKEEVYNELLKQAFPVYHFHNVLIDLNARLLYVEAGSHKKAEDVLAFLRRSLGSLPVQPYLFNKESLAEFFSHQLNQDDESTLSVFEDTFEVEHIATGTKIKCTKADFDNCDNLLDLMGSSFYIRSLSFDYDDKLHFTLNDKGIISKIKVPDLETEVIDHVGNIQDDENSSLIYAQGKLFLVYKTLIEMIDHLSKMP